MFSNGKAAQIAAMNVTITAQAQSIKTLGEALGRLEAERDRIEREVADLRRDLKSRDSRIAQLEGYLADLGINLSAVDGAGAWWGRAKRAIVIQVDGDRLNDDLSFVNDEQRAYATSVAQAAVRAAE